MNNFISSELTLFAKEIQRILSPIVLKEIANKDSFVQRSSKYQAYELSPFVFGSAKKGSINAIIQQL
ncbi:hypothetical protein HRF87_05795 [Bacillus sp. CRN 9]|nr:hypothetical protein [Bacillus sp. CRN 9]